MNKVISNGYMVVFTIPSNGSDYFDTLEQAKGVRDMVAGGGTIYRATIEKHGLNCFPVCGEMVRKGDGTPL